MFLRNCWYAAGFPEEIGRDLLARTFLNENVVLFRKTDGTPVALEDRCAHRRLPLSMGTLIGDRLQCGYHGLEYDCTGACVKIPGQLSVPGGAGVRAYPLVERHRYLWIWMGDPRRADVSLIPDYGKLDDPDWGTSRIQLNYEAHYQLVVDNLLDLSHLAYVHNTTTGNTAISEDAEVKTEVKGNRVQVKRWASDISPAPTFVEFGGYNANIDSWQISEFSPPSYVKVNYGSAAAGSGIPKGEGFWRQGTWGFQVFHGITPESERTTHQFRYVAHQFGLGDDRVTQEFYRQCDQIINEDVAVFPVQQRSIDSDPGATWDNINSRVAVIHDKGLLRARDIVALLLAEQAAKGP